MYKIFFILAFVVSLNAQMVDGVAIIVKGKAITLYDIQKEMKISKLDAKKASDILIRKKLEEIETTERKIGVTSSEVYDDIKKTASRNNLSVSEFYKAVRDANGISSKDLKIKVKEKLLSKKLYGAIAYSHISEPSSSEIEEYYEIHKENFVHPSSFNVVIYQAQSRKALEDKIANPMFNAPSVGTSEQVLPYERISPELASLLEKTPQYSYTPVIPDGKGGHMSFYIQSVESAQEGGVEGVSNQIKNMIMADKREQVLGDYFARLRLNADIQTLREVE